MGRRDPPGGDHGGGVRATGRGGAARGAARLRGPRAESAHYDAGRDRVIVRLTTGVEIGVAPRDVEGLAGAPREALAEIEVEAMGLGIHFPRLDADLYVPALLEGVLGSKAWMAARLARRREGRGGAGEREARREAAEGGRGLSEAPSRGVRPLAPEERMRRDADQNGAELFPEDRAAACGARLAEVSGHAPQELFFNCLTSVITPEFDRTATL